MASINRHFGYAHVWGQEGSYFRIETDGRAVPIQKKDVEQSCANLSVEVTTKEGAKYVNAFKHWNSAADKLIFDRVVYDPEGKRVNSNERTLNLWRGLSRKARRGNWARMRRHLRDVICDGDTKAFRYLLQWFAHAMQHPGTAPGTVIVMKSEREGTGKSSTCSWLTRIFGEHGAEFNSAEQLLGKHNAHLETLSCIVVNEPTFAGDKAANRKLKSMISDAWWTIEPKFRGVYRVPNIAHMMFTTNEPWAVAAGAGARRYLVLEVSPAKAGDASYFAKLNHEVDHGGLEAFLHFLLRLDIRGFDPRRDLPKTAALAEQQILSAPLHVQWALELAERGRTGQGQFGFATGNPITFGADAATADLHRDYLDFAKGRFGVPLSLRAFGKYLAGIGLQQRQLGKQRHKGFSMPHPDQFEALVKAERKIEG